MGKGVSRSLVTDPLSTSSRRWRTMDGAPPAEEICTLAHRWTQALPLVDAVRETDFIHNAKTPHLDDTIVRILLLLLLLLLSLRAVWRLTMLNRSHTNRQ